MANNHIISIEKEAKLSIDTGRLEIAFLQNDEKHYFAPFDIAVLILAHPCISLSSAVPKELSSAGAVILHAGDNFMPVGLTIPIAINQEGAKRPHLQAKYVNSEAAKIWWKQIIQSKIFGQASVLQYAERNEFGRLIAIANKVLKGDEDKKEALAAKFYWKVYFEYLDLAVNERHKQNAEDIVNISLNYSYAIIRAMVARSLTSAGLCLNLGVGHYRRDNPFNLVEDFIEPFRFIADKAVLEILSKNDYQTFESKLKKSLLTEILQTVIKIKDTNYRLFQAIDFAINSFCLSLDIPSLSLLLPNTPIKRGVKSNIPELPHIKYEI
jgi:CRISPR-associated protein Cas1